MSFRLLHFCMLIFLFDFFCILSKKCVQNEEERDESEEKEKDLQQITTMNNSKFGVSDTMVDDKQVKTIDQNNRPNDLPSLSSNHIITSPTNSNSNSTAVWNTDSWADGDFEPIEPNSGMCVCVCELYSVHFRFNFLLTI